MAIPRLRGLLGPAVLLALVAGCAAPVHYEYNPAPYASWHSFAWKAPAPGTVRNPILDSGILATRVAEAVKSTLAGKGYTEVAAPANADFLATYHTALRESQQPGSSFGFAYGTFGPGYNTVFVDTGPNRRMQEGSLILDVIDAGTHKLVWRGWVTRDLEQNQYSATAVNRAVQRILARFPPQEGQ